MKLIFIREVADQDLQALSEALGVQYDPKNPPTQEDVLVDIESQAMQKLDVALKTVFTKQEFDKVQSQIDSLSDQATTAADTKLEEAKNPKP